MDIKNLVSRKVLNDRYLKDGETLEEQVDRIVTAVSSVEKDKEFWKDKFKDIIDNRLFIPAGRIISGAGINKKLTLSNCFTLNFIPDSMDEIFNFVKYGALVHKQGGGTGYNYSLIRPKGVPTSNDAIASGVISFMNVFDAQTKCVNAGSRRGANMSMLYILHPDILEYIDAKSYEEDKLTQFNMSVLVDDKFMKAVEDDEEVALIYPCMDQNGNILSEKDKDVKVFKRIKAKELWDKIVYKAYMYGEPGVIYYDNLNKYNNTYYIENIVTCNPCSEYISGVIKGHNDYFGACNLGSLFLHNFVVNPFKKDAYFDENKLIETVNIAIRFLDDVLDINRYPLENFKKYQDNMRTIGLGITGLADMLTMLNMKYSSKEAVEFVDRLMELITFNAYMTSNRLAKEKGCFPLLEKDKFINSGFLNKYKGDKKWDNLILDIKKHGIRNARLMSVAPAGTISVAYGENCSSGVEPIFSLEYYRDIHVGGQTDDCIQKYKMQDYAYKIWEETKEKVVDKDVFETALNLSVDSHVNMLSIVGKHIDMSISKTINIPTEYTFEETKNVYYKCWKNGVRGCTIFRPNEVRKGILSTENNKENKKELGRGEYETTPDDIIEIKRKLVSGCGKMMLHIGIIPREKRIFDVYVTNSSKGGCTLNIQNLAITMSNALRVGSNLESLKKSFEGAGVCPSYTTARAKGKNVSKGSSCGLSILYALLDVEKDLKNEELLELQKIGYYTKKIEEEIINNKNEDTKGFNNEEKKYLEEYGEIAFSKKYHKCPICGNDELFTGDGCITCLSCSWTKC